MTYTELKAEARKVLTGKWGQAALITLVYSIILVVLAFILNLIPVIGSLAYTVISFPLAYGFIASMMKLKRGQEVGYVDFFNDGFNSFGKVWAVFGNMLLKLIIPLILVFVSIIILIFGGAGTAVGVVSGSTTATTGFSGIIIIGFIAYFASVIYLTCKSYYYSLSYFILFDKKDATAKEIVEESEKLMKGNRWHLFWLPLAFLGWMILAALSFYIGMFWLIPYMMITYVVFYESLAGKKTEAAPVVDAPKAEAKEAEVVAEEPVKEEEVNPIQNMEDNKSDDDEV